MKVTNISKGPRGINTDKGLIILAPGESRDDLTLLSGEKEDLEPVGWFEFGAHAKAAPAKKED